MYSILSHYPCAASSSHNWKPRRPWHHHGMPIVERTVTAIAIGTCVGALLAGCTAGSESNTTSTTPSAPAQSSETNPSTDVAPGLEKFYSQKPSWGSCDDYETDEPLSSSLECARISVPIDYDNPDGDEAQIAISRSPASGDRIGSLLFNPGGPGLGGLSMAATVGSGTAVEERFDRIGFDPRGIGASTPTIRCLTPAENDAERQDLDIDESPAGIAETEKEEKEVADKCAERSGTNLLAHVGTREVVRDMDIIRAVLGDDKLNFVGYSYGTRIGAAYAEAFPEKVRALVLDGAVDPEADPLDELVKQFAGFQKAFDDYAADCAESSQCPLGTDPANANRNFRALIDPLIDRPARTTDPRGLGYNDAQTGVLQALYSPQLWRPLTTGLKELQEGRGDTLLGLADLYSGRLDDGTYSNLNDAFEAIRCVDDPRITDRAKVGETNLRIREVAPFLDDGKGTGQAPLDSCVFWPVPNTGEPHTLSVPGLPKVVVVSTPDDPATPYQAGVNLARQLGASLITFRGTQHTVALSSGERCVDDAVIDYLTDLTPPAPDLTC